MWSLAINGAQEGDLSDLLAGRLFPLAVKLKEVDAEWRRFTIQSSGTVRDNISVNVNGSTSGSTSQNNNLLGAVSGGRVYITKGLTVAACGQTYLVAYHLPGNALDLSVLLQAAATKSPPAPIVLTLESSLPLALLNVQTIGSLDEIKLCDASAEIADSERAAKVFTDILKSQSGGSSTNSGASAKREIAPTKAEDH